MPNDFAGRTVSGGYAPRPDVADPQTRAELEARAGIESLDALLQERTALVERVADLRAKYGSFGTFDHLRKIELSRIKSLVRLEALRDKRKMTNDQADDEAHEHPDYTAFVVAATRERAEFFRLEAAIEHIDYRINRGQALARYAASEAGMAR